MRVVRGRVATRFRWIPEKKKILREDADRFDMPETGRSVRAGLKEHPPASTSTSKTAAGFRPANRPSIAVFGGR
jgi:hypothetical protein